MTRKLKKNRQKQLPYGSIFYNRTGNRNRPSAANAAKETPRPHVKQTCGRKPSEQRTAP